jgi:hypothetical protein
MRESGGERVGHNIIIWRYFHVLEGFFTSSVKLLFSSRVNYVLGPNSSHPESRMRLTRQRGILEGKAKD